MAGLTELQEAELMDIADHLVGTLGDMDPKQADEQVAKQVEKIYKLLGYEVKTFVTTKEAASHIRICFKKDLA